MSDDPAVSPRVMAASTQEVTPRRAELRRLGGAARSLIEGLVGTDASEEVISLAADELEALATRFSSDVPRSMYDGIAESSMAEADPGGFFDHSPMIGRSNPVAPPVTIEVTDDRVIGHASFGSAYEGPPGCVHGGYVAAAFDEVLGSAQTFSGSPGMTGTLTIRYRSPTPLHTPLRFEGHFDRQERRKVFTSGTVHAGDQLCAEAEGIFISIEVARFQELLEERDARFG